MHGSRPATAALLSHFRCKSQFIHGVFYCVIAAEDRKRFPELGEAYAIAVEELSSTQNGQAHYWLLASEVEYDDEVLFVMSGLPQCNLPKIKQ